MCDIEITQTDGGRRFLIEARGAEITGHVKFAVGEKGKSLNWYDARKEGSHYATLNYLPNGNRDTTYTVHVYCDDEYIDEQEFYVPHPSSFLLISYFI